jgi:hypothetical protein
MVRRLLTCMATLVVALGSFAVSPAMAVIGRGHPTCEIGFCVYSGKEFTGTKVELRITRFNECQVPSAPGLDSFQSAAVNGKEPITAVLFYSDTECTEGFWGGTTNNVSSFTPSPMRSLRMYR